MKPREVAEFDEVAAQRDAQALARRRSLAAALVAAAFLAAFFTVEAEFAQLRVGLVFVGILSAVLALMWLNAGFKPIRVSTTRSEDERRLLGLRGVRFENPRVSALRPQSDSAPTTPPSITRTPVSTSSALRTPSSATSPLSMHYSSNPLTRSSSQFLVPSTSTTPTAKRGATPPATLPSPARSRTPITDAASYEQYMRMFSEYEQKRTALARSPTSAIEIDPKSPMAARPQTPYRSPAVPTTTDKKKATWADFAVTNDENSKKLYRELHVEHSIDRWSDNVRHWLAAIVLKPLVAFMAHMEKQLGVTLEKVQVGTPQQADPNQSQLSNISQFNWGHKPRTGDAGGGFTFNTDALMAKSATGLTDQQRKAQEELQQQLGRLEAFFHIDGVYSSREYMIKRIRELAEGDFLKNYRWIEGDEGKGAWASDAPPADSQILMHLFVTFMNQRVLPVDSNKEKENFTARHFRIDTSSELRLPGKLEKTNVVILQTHLKPPHFNVVVDEKNLWEVMRGRHNIFHAIALFTYHIMHNLNGTLDHTHIATSNFQMDRIVDY